MKWLEDLFFLVAFVVAVALVTLSVYDGGNAYPTVSSARVVAASENPDREMPPARRMTPQNTASTQLQSSPGDAAPAR